MPVSVLKGECVVTNGSPVVTVTSPILQVDDVLAGHGFLGTDGVWYTVAAPAVGQDFNLTTNYGGVTDAAMAFELSRDSVGALPLPRKTMDKPYGVIAEAFTRITNLFNEFKAVEVEVGHLSDAIYHPYVTLSDPAAASANTTAINAAISAASLEGGGWVKIPAGRCYVNTILMKSGVELVGVNRRATILVDERADSFNVIQSADPTTTLLWSAVEDLQVQKPNATGGTLVDMTSWQHSRVRRTWLTSSSVAGTLGVGVRGLYTAGPVFTTEGTNNVVEENYIGLVAFGIRAGPNANALTLRKNRVQPNVNGGMGFLIGSTGVEAGVEGYPNNVLLDENSVETIGVTGVTGVRIEPEADGVTVMNHRNEGVALTNGIVAVPGCTNVKLLGNHTSSISGAAVVGADGVNVIDYDAVDLRGLPRALVNFIGPSGAMQGTALNVSDVVRNAAGHYTVTFATPVPTPLTFSGGVISSANLSMTFPIVTSTYVEIYIKDAAGTLTDATQISVSIWSLA